MKKNKQSHSRLENGSILVFSILILLTMTVIVLAMAAVFLPKLGLSSNISSSTNAIYAADSGIEWCLFVHAWDSNNSAPILSNGATYTITPGDCTVSPLDIQAVGTFRGISRSFQITTP